MVSTSESSKPLAANLEHIKGLRALLNKSKAGIYIASITDTQINNLQIVKLPYLIECTGWKLIFKILQLTKGILVVHWNNVVIILNSSIIQTSLYNSSSGFI